jgi:SpoVK/Ycf46/Vps4 family AAA+-type ATPase
MNSLFHREEFVRNGLGALKGVLISGYSGAGKTAILR